MTDNANALAYAHSIEQRLRELAEIASEYGEDITSDRLRDISAQCRDDNDMESADVASKAAALLDLDGLGDDSEGFTIWDRYIGTALEITVTGSRSLHSYEWDVESVRLLVSFGGPNLRIVSDHRDGVTLECWWWSDTVTVRCPELVELGAALWERGEQ